MPNTIKKLKFLPKTSQILPNRRNFAKSGSTSPLKDLSQTDVKVLRAPTEAVIVAQLVEWLLSTPEVRS